MTPLRTTSPEETAEAFIQAAIDSAPEPLRRLGEWLSTVLDEDQWAKAEPMLLGAVQSSAVVLEALENIYEAYQKSTAAADWDITVSRAVTTAIAKARGQS